MQTPSLIFRNCVTGIFLAIFFNISLLHAQDFQKDVIQTDEGPLTISFVGHGSLMFDFNNYTIHIDPSTREADYGQMPDADLVLITHHHGDHFDKDALENIVSEDTRVLLTATCADNLGSASPGNPKIMKNGDQTVFKAKVNIQAIPAYNLEHMRDNGEPYHPKGVGNGYVLTFGNKKVYVAGDTENIPEMKALEGIDIAFLPMNLPYTMTPEMVADAAKAFKPKILYPYHYGSTDPSELVELMEGEEAVEVRVRDM